MRLYARAGLALRPAVAAAGIPDRTRIPDVAARVEDAGAAGIGIADALGRRVRGAGHGRDLPRFLESGARLLLFEDRAFAIVAATGPIPLVAARDDAAAAAVLWGALAAAPRGAAEVAAEQYAAAVDTLTALLGKPSGDARATTIRAL
jgi:hypothetical protein